MLTGMAVPGSVELNAPVAAVTPRLSPGTRPVKLAPPSTSVASAVPSSVLSSAVMPVTAVMLARVMSAAVVAVVL